MDIQGNSHMQREEQYDRVKDISRNQDAKEKDNAGKTDDNKDKVSISGKAREISGHSELRTDKIEAIKKAVDAGDYNIDSTKVANKILELI